MQEKLMNVSTLDENAFYEEFVLVVIGLGEVFYMHLVYHLSI